MSIETKSMHITPVGGNVFADLGFEPEEAAALKAESQRIISEKLGHKGFPDGRIVRMDWREKTQASRGGRDSSDVKDGSAA